MKKLLCTLVLLTIAIPSTKALNPNHEIITYGQSEQGRDLICYSISDANYHTTILLTFAIHGFEDSYKRDGQALTDTALNLIDYYKNTGLPSSIRLLIVPSANPDGLSEGKTQNGFGRCNAKGIDLNRDFAANHKVRKKGRYYTPYPFSAKESRALADLVLTQKPDIVIDFHGWINCTIGDQQLAQIFRQELNLPHKKAFTSTNYGSFAYWSHKQGAKALLVEFKSPKIDLDQLINTIDSIIQTKTAR